MKTLRSPWSNMREARQDPQLRRRNLRLAAVLAAVAFVLYVAMFVAMSG